MVFCWWLLVGYFAGGSWLDILLVVLGWIFCSVGYVVVVG